MATAENIDEIWREWDEKKQSRRDADDRPHYRDTEAELQLEPTPPTPSEPEDDEGEDDA